MTIDIPYIKALVEEKTVLEDGREGHFIECYIYSVTAILNRPLLFNIHTIHGALYSRLPIWKLFHKVPTEYRLNKRALEPWGVLGNRVQCTKHAYLKDYGVIWIRRNWSGMYLMSFDYFDGGFSEDPEQSKTIHLIAMYDGNMALLPNNELLFKDNHFTTTTLIENIPRYKRNTEYFEANG